MESNTSYSYNTLQKTSEGLYKEKGSKFHSYASPCYTESEARVLLSSWRKAHPQARHLCYAYRLGVTNYQTRTNDDGEPNNSAGQPILGQIQSQQLSNTLIGVIRYFGGTKLGVGGLIHAYKTAAKEAIQSGEIITKELHEHLKLEFNHNLTPIIMNLIKTNQLKVQKQDFQLECSLIIEIPLTKSTQLKKTLKSQPILITELGIY